jgi:hypothetical protein
MPEDGGEIFRAEVIIIQQQDDRALRYCLSELGFEDGCASELLLPLPSLLWLAAINLIRSLVQPNNRSLGVDI